MKLCCDHSFIHLSCAVLSRGTLFVFQTTSNIDTRQNLDPGQARNLCDSYQQEQTKESRLRKNRVYLRSHFSPGTNIAEMRKMFGEVIFELEQKELK